jgi:hypothetical protein
MAKHCNQPYILVERGRRGRSISAENPTAFMCITESVHGKGKSVNNKKFMIYRKKQGLRVKNLN